MFKRLLVFLLVVAVLTAGLLLYAWLRGETEEEEIIKKGFLYWSFWAIALSFIGYFTHYIIKGKK